MKIFSVNISPRVQCGKTAGKMRVSATQFNPKLHCRDFVRMYQTRDFPREQIHQTTPSSFQQNVPNLGYNAELWTSRNLGQGVPWCVLHDQASGCNGHSCTNGGHRGAPGQWWRRLVTQHHFMVQPGGQVPVGS